MSVKNKNGGDSLEGKMCLVTGSSRGIGFFLARGLAYMPHK